MSHSTTPTTLDRIIATLSASLDCTKVLAAAESRIGGIAAVRLIGDVETALRELSALRMDALRDELAASLPRVSGGGHDDHEEVSTDFLRDPMSWPDDSDPIRLDPPHVHDYADASSWDAWTDEDRWEPTPLDVLAYDDMADAHAHDQTDWDALESSWSEQDQIAAFGTW